MRAVSPNGCRTTGYKHCYEDVHIAEYTTCCIVFTSSIRRLPCLFARSQQFGCVRHCGRRPPGTEGLFRYHGTQRNCPDVSFHVGFCVAASITRGQMYGTLKCSNEIGRGAIVCGVRHVLPCAKHISIDVCIGMRRHTKSYRGEPVLAC